MGRVNNMAKNGKISSNLLAELINSRSKRPFGNLPPRRYYLIICEGEQTEPNYFESIRKKLPNEMIRKITIKGMGRSTQALLERAQKEVDFRKKSSLPPFYKIWVVFDKDSFNDDDFDNTINSIKDKTTKSEVWNVAWSNEAFELWYILHFVDQIGGALSRESYSKMLSKYLNRQYEKNSTDMFDKLKPHVYEAICRAEKALLKQANKPYHAQNPATTVHILVKELLSYIPSVR